jgi:hypothetical protein
MKITANTSQMITVKNTPASSPLGATRVAPPTPTAATPLQASSPHRCHRSRHRKSVCLLGRWRRGFYRLFEVRPARGNDAPAPDLGVSDLASWGPDPTPLGLDRRGGRVVQEWAHASLVERVLGVRGGGCARWRRHGAWLQCEAVSRRPGEDAS